MKRVAMAAFSGVQLLDVIGPLDVFDAAERLRADDLYSVTVVSPSGGPVAASGGVAIMTTHADVALQQPLDLLVVPGALEMEAMLADAQYLEMVERLAAHATQVASVCTGAFTLGILGLLDGKRVTTHWAKSGELAAMFPKARVEPDHIFVADGDLYTCGGVASGMDLALGIITEDHGQALARRVAKWMVIYLQRPGGQSQFGIQTTLPDTSPPQIRHAIEGVIAAPHHDHSVPELAKRAGVSRRHFARLFRQATGTTPARYVESVRAELARTLLETTNADHETIARHCGFTNAETMRQAFQRRYHVSPRDHRTLFGHPTEHQ